MKTQTKTKNVTLRAWKVRAIVEFIIERENFYEADEDEDMEEGVFKDMDLATEEDVRESLLNQLVKVKSGILDNRVYGEISQVESVEPTECTQEITISDSVTD